MLAPVREFWIRVLASTERPEVAEYAYLRLNGASHDEAISQTHGAGGSSGG